MVGSRQVRRELLVLRQRGAGCAAAADGGGAAARALRHVGGLVRAVHQHGARGRLALVFGGNNQRHRSNAKLIHPLNRDGHDPYTPNKT